MLKTNKLFIHLCGILAAMLMLAGCEATITDPITPASQNPPLNGESPEVIVESLRGNEYVKGGVLYQIHMIITDPTLDTNSSTIEFSRDGGLTWTTATSSTGQDGADFATFSGVETIFNWSVPREMDCLAYSATSDGGNYKIRVTTRGRPDAFPTVWVSPGLFTVDSCAPVVSGMNFAYSTTLNRGFSSFSLPDISDVFSLSPIKDVCVKINAGPAAPTEFDSCWMNVNSFNADPGQTTITGASIPFFFGFTSMPASATATLWARDYAHNQSELSLVASMPTGVLGTDIADSFLRSCGGSFCTSATITGGVVSSNVVVNSVSVLTKSDSPDANTSLLDPQMFVVNSAGIVYLRDKLRGIVKIDPVLGTQTVLVALSGSISDGPVGSAAVKKPMRLALDREENLIVFDYDRIRRINLNVAPGSETIETIVGGGSDTSGTVKTALDLEIDYHDNLLYYGTFQVLPNNWIVFNSEDPLKQLNNSALPDESDRFRLRVYRPDRENKIVSIKLSGTGVDIEASQAVAQLWPYGGMAVTYDSANKKIANIYARLCDDDTTCVQQSLGTFDEDGVATTSAVIVPSYFSNNYMFVSRTNNLYSMNRYEGFVMKHNGSSWDKLVGKDNAVPYPGSLCTDGASKTNCNINLYDAFVGANERLYFIDNGRIRFVDSGKVYTHVTLTP